jgi:hypothetical protein
MKAIDENKVTTAMSCTICNSAKMGAQVFESLYKNKTPKIIYIMLEALDFKTQQ